MATCLSRKPSATGCVILFNLKRESVVKREELSGFWIFAPATIFLGGETCKFMRKIKYEKIYYHYHVINFNKKNYEIQDDKLYIIFLKFISLTLINS